MSFRSEAPCIALICNSGIAEAVCNNNVTSFKGRPYDLFYVLDPCGVVEEQFGHVVHFLTVGRAIRWFQWCPAAAMLRIATLFSSLPDRIRFSSTRPASSAPD